SNIGQAGNIGTLVALSIHPGTTNEQIVYNVQELYGSYYLAVVPQDPSVLGTSFTLRIEVTPPVDPYPFVPCNLIDDVTTPMVDPTVRTLIFANSNKMNALYPTEAVTITNLFTQLDVLAANGNVEGVVVDLDNIYPNMQNAYSNWNSNLGNPLEANCVATHIKSLIYSMLPAYPNLEYIVVVGEDRVIPHRRI
ncbi:MAG: hypothetical protein GY805_24225, partial [Chloroflexi bacterium]|nr:hypothetical protein [Chloroflexota bacterium]